MSAAAELLGITDGAVRKRIERGQLAGRKISGQWQVLLNATDVTEHDTTKVISATRPITRQLDNAMRHDTTNATDTTLSRVDITAMQVQLEERYIATIERLQEGHRQEVDRLQAGHEETIAAKDGELSTAMLLVEELRLRAERSESRVSDLEAQQAESSTMTEITQPEQLQRAWWQFWRDS